jgi:hypothetical protein
MCCARGLSFFPFLSIAFLDSRPSPTTIIGVINKNYRHWATRPAEPPRENFATLEHRCEMQCPRGSLRYAQDPGAEYASVAQIAVFNHVCLKGYSCNGLPQ